MGCILCKSKFKYEKLDSNTKKKKLGYYKHYVFLLEKNTTFNYIYYHFVIYNKRDNELINKILLTLNSKPTFIRFKYDDNINADNNPEFDRLIDFALNYYEDFILPKKKFLEIDSSNKEVFVDIVNVLENEVTKNSSSEDIQTLLYEVGKKHEFDNLKDFFKLVYQVMLGQDQGPRLGSFFKLFGLRETIDYLKKLIDN